MLPIPILNGIEPYDPESNSDSIAEEATNIVIQEIIKLRIIIDILQPK
jgi:hypothetical protein